LAKPHKTKTWHTFPLFAKPSETKTWYAFLVVAKLGKTKITPSQYCQNLAKPSPPQVWQNLENQNLAHLSSIGQTYQNQNHPFPMMAKRGKTKTWFGFQAIGKTR
jgi:hypothetical protein